MWRQKAKDGTTQLVGGLTIQGVFNALYPVGSVIFTTDNTNPGTRYGGTTWAAFGAGRAIVGVGNNGEHTYTSEQTFGEDAHQLTAAESGVNSHTHTGGIYPGYTSGFNTNHQHTMVSLQKHATNTPNSNADNGGNSTLQGGTVTRWTGGQSGLTNTANTDHVHVVGGVEAGNGMGPPTVAYHENRQRSIALYAWKRTA